MMKLIEISRMPTTAYSVGDIRDVHESTLRAWHILEKAKSLLAAGVPPVIVLELIQEMEGK